MRICYKTNKVLESRYDLPGRHVNESSKAIAEEQFQNVELQSYSKVMQINRSKLFRCLVSNFNNRLIENTSSRSSNESENISFFKTAHSK